MENEQLSLREIQLASLDILKTIDGICRQENLRYWLAYGSLIGAIRHQGFIPWDDDLDICLPRPDYEKLVQYFEEHEEELRPLVAIRNKPERTIPFLITRVSNTTYNMIGEYGDGIEELGTFVDVYPLDGLGNDEASAIARKKESFSLMVKYAHAGNFAEYNRSNGAMKKMLKAFRSNLMGDPQEYANQQQQLLKRDSYEDSAYVSVASWGRIETAEDVFLASDFSSSIEVQFEDMTTFAPVGYDAILKKFYHGDYMVLPPEEKRISQHHYSIVPRQ